MSFLLERAAEREKKLLLEKGKLIRLVGYSNDTLSRVATRIDTVIQGVGRDLDKTPDGDLRDLVVRIMEHIQQTRDIARKDLDAYETDLTRIARGN